MLKICWLFVLGLAFFSCKAARNQSEIKEITDTASDTKFKCWEGVPTSSEAPLIAIFKSVAENYVRAKKTDVYSCVDLKNFLSSEEVFLNLSHGGFTDKDLSDSFQYLAYLFPKAKLIGLDLSYNNLTTYKPFLIPGLVENATLVYLDISYNQYSGQISSVFPTSGTTYKQLLILNVEGNKFSGDIDEDYFSTIFGKLIFFNARSNNLSSFSLDNVYPNLKYLGLGLNAPTMLISLYMEKASLDLIHFDHEGAKVYSADRLAKIFSGLGSFNGKSAKTANGAPAPLNLSASFIDLRNSSFELSNTSVYDQVWRTKCQGQAKCNDNATEELPLGGCAAYKILAPLAPLLTEEADKTNFASSLVPYKKYCAI